jgi:hypothetical protein
MSAAQEGAEAATDAAANAAKKRLRRIIMVVSPFRSNPSVTEHDEFPFQPGHGLEIDFDRA